MVFRIWFLLTIRSNEMNKNFNIYEQDIDMFLIRKKKITQTIAYKKVKWHFTGNNSWPSAMVCDLARLFSDNMAILNYQFGGIFAAFFAFRSNSSHSGVASPCTGIKWLWICSQFQILLKNEKNKNWDAD